MTYAPVMLTFPADSWVFWVAVAAGLGLFFRFGLYPRRDEPRPVRRMAALGTLAVAAVLVTAFLPGLVLSSLLGAGVAGDVIDLALWCTAAVLAAVTMLVLAWALFSDRARGRPRCPGCWYDMAGTPGLTCPECGKAVRTSRHLYGTRRRWRAMPAVAILVLLTVGVGAAPMIRSDEWHESLPDAVLFAAMPFASPTGRLNNELRDRVYGSRHSSSALHLKRGDWLTGKLSRWAMRWCLTEDPAGARADFAVNLLMRADAAEHFVPELATLSTRESVTALELLVQHAPAHPAVKSSAEPLLSSQHLRFQHFAAFALTRHYVNDPQASQIPPEVQALLDSATLEHRAGVINALGNAPMNPAVHAVIAAALSDSAVEVRQMALHVLQSRAPEDPLFESTVRSWLASTDQKECRAALWVFVRSQSLHGALGEDFSRALVTLTPSDFSALLVTFASNARRKPQEAVRIIAACDAVAGERPSLMHALQTVPFDDSDSIALLNGLEAKWRAEGDTANADNLRKLIDRAEGKRPDGPHN